MAPKQNRGCSVPKHHLSEKAPVDLPPAWELPRRLDAAEVVARLTACFQDDSTPGDLVWRYFEMLKRPALTKVILHHRDPEHPDVISNRTSAAHLRHLAFEVVCNQLPDKARRDQLSSFRTVVGLTDAEIVRCDSFGEAVALAKPLLEEMREAVLESFAGVQRNRTAENVVRGVNDRKRPTADEFDLSILDNVSTTLRDLRVENFMHRLTTDGLAQRAGLIVSLSGITRNFPAVNAALAAAGLAEFSTVDALYTFVTLAIRCEELDDYMAQFRISFCEFAENKSDNAQTYDRDELIQQVSDSKAVSDGMRADVFLLSRVLALLERQEHLKPAAFHGVTICLRTALWFAPQHVVLPTATLSVGDVRKRLSEGPNAGGPGRTFAHALLSLFAEAISGWLHRYFDEYGTDPWKGNFRAKWATASASNPLEVGSFYLSVYRSLYGHSGVALWCGLPLRIWVAGDGDAVIHEFFPRRKENIAELLASMPRKTVVSWP
jgi:hypothetical protein